MLNTNGDDPRLPRWLDVRGPSPKTREGPNTELLLNRSSRG